MAKQKSQYKDNFQLILSMSSKSIKDKPLMCQDNGKTVDLLIRMELWWISTKMQDWSVRAIHVYKHSNLILVTNTKQEISLENLHNTRSRSMVQGEIITDILCFHEKINMVDYIRTFPSIINFEEFESVIIISWKKKGESTYDMYSPKTLTF